MVNPWLERRTSFRVVLLCALLGPSLLLAQPQRPSGPGIGIHYGVPLKWSAVLALTMPGGAEAANAFIALEPGIGGWRASVGYFRITTQLGSGYVIRTSFLRPGKRAWRAPPGASYLGAELQVMPLFVMGLRVGGFARVGGANGHRTLFTADLSLML